MRGARLMRPFRVSGRESAHVFITLSTCLGIKPLREEIVKFHQKLDGINHFTESDVICGPGSKELIYLTMTALTTDLILLDPAWPSYAPQGEMFL